MQMSRKDFDRALRDSFSQQFNDVPRNESDIEYEFSERFVSKMEKLISKQKKASWRMTNTSAKRVAVIAAVIILLIVGTMSVSAVREPVLKVITELFETHIDFEFDGKTTSAITEVYELTWLPEGFEQVSKGGNDAVFTTEYRNDRGNAILLQQSVTESASLSLDNEQGDVKFVIANGRKILMNMGEKASIITWMENGYIIDIIYQGYVEEDIILKLAESISICEE